MNKVMKFSLGFFAIMAVLALAVSVSAAGAVVSTINTPTAGANYNVGQTITLSGSASGGTETYASYRWTFSDATAPVIGQNQTVAFATAGSKTITLSVMDSDGVAGATSVTVNVVGGASAKPVISNIAVSNITQTSVTITWTTDIVASSRVIYDTVSHPDITGAGSPNFGYAASSAETDTVTKVTTHSVVLNGLNPGTKYYFRVLSQG